MPAKILVASADQSVTHAAEAALRRDDHELITAAQGADALSAWKADSPTVSVIDVALPGTGGVELARRIRRAEGGTRRSGVLLLGPPEVALKIDALRAGADDYVNQPLNPQELAARVRALLARLGHIERTIAAPSTRNGAGRLLAYYGAKGGVGTTTLAINSAIALHRETKRSVALKNVRLLLDTMGQIGVPADRMELILNRNKAFTGISAKSIESVLRRPIEHQVVNDYRTAISSLNTGTPFMIDNADSPLGRDVVTLARAICRDDVGRELAMAGRLALVAG